MAKGFNIVDYVLAQAADSPVKKFDGGGGVDGSGSIAGQIFAQQPTGGMNFGPSFNSMLGGSAPLGGVGFSSGALDSTYAELDPGLDPAMTEEELQKQAAARYKTAVDNYRIQANRDNKAELDAAKQALVYLDVSRDQITAAGIDASRGISGVMGPSVSGVLGDIGQGAIDLIGAGGQKFSDAITLGQGPEVAQTLLDPISVLLGGFGGTVNYGQSGSTTPLIIGNTTSGQPVGLSVPDPRAIFEGGLSTLIPGIGTLGAIGAAAALDGNDQAVASGVGLSPAGVLAAANDADDKTKTDPAATGTFNDASAVAATPIKPAPSVSIDRPNSATPIKDAPSVSIARPDSTAQDLDVAEIIRTNAGTDVGLLVDTNQVKTQPEVKVPASSSSAASGGNNPSAGGGGISEVAGEPGELVDIDYLFDVGGDSIFAPEILEEDEDELLYPYRGGGAVKRFSGTAGSAVSAYPPASLVPEEDGGTMKTGKNIFQKGLPALIGAGLGAAFGLTDKDDPNPSGYQGGIPEYKYNRSLVPDAFSTTNVDGTPRRPGSAGRSYFTQGAYDPIMETVDDVEVQSTLGGAQRRADAVDAATQQATQDALYQQIYDDFVALQPGDDTPGSGSMEAAAAGMGATQDATPAPAPAPTPISATPTGGGTSIPSDITFSPDVTAEDFAIGAATGPVQQPTTDVFSAYDAVVNQYNPDATTYDSGDINTVISAITNNKVGTANVAKDFGISESEVWGGLLRQGAYTPAGLASYIATNTNQPDYTEVDLMVRLLEDGQTSAEEVLAYYQYTDPEQFGNTTLAEVKEYFKQLGGTRTLAQGGMLQENGYYLGGTTDGMADQIPATIDNSQPAALSDGEFVVPADVVSHLGNGNSEAGATQLYSMMDRVRKKRTGTVKQGTEINPMQQLPA